MAKKREPATPATEAPAQPKQVGRPPFAWTEEIEDAILDELMAGESIMDILGDDRQEGFPTDKTFFKHLRDSDSFFRKYTRAREFQMEKEVEEIKAIADDGRNDWMEKHGQEDAGWHLNGEHVQRSRLRIDARKWRASKMAPKKYGDKLGLGAADGLDPVQTVSKELTDAERAVRLARAINDNPAAMQALVAALSKKGAAK